MLYNKNSKHFQDGNQQNINPKNRALQAITKTLFILVNR